MKNLVSMMKKSDFYYNFEKNLPALDTIFGSILDHRFASAPLVDSDIPNFGGHRCPENMPGFAKV